MRDIVIYNSLSRSKLRLEPLIPGLVKIYVCGVTTYDHCHIGHAAPAIYFDVIRRYLAFEGYQVRYVRNYTDVDDKIIARAASRGQSPRQLAAEMVHSAEEDMRALGVLPADFEPKVSEHIPQIIAMIETLIAKERAYQTHAGDVYYRVRRQASYGILSQRDPDELRSGTRELKAGDKEDPLDFALWKADLTPEASWDSPFGRGRPGWHIECSAMAKAYLGESFDIHGGGLDLKFPHHENEIAQSEAANGCSYAAIWMHIGLLTINKQKMSKSLGNHISIKDFLSQWPGEVLRLSYLNQHYASPTDFTEEVYELCARRLVYYYETLLHLQKLGTLTAASDRHHPSIEALKEGFSLAMSDDFNTSKALAEINLACKKANEWGPKQAAPAKALAEVLGEAGGVLGLFSQDPGQILLELKSKVIKKRGIAQEWIDERIKARTEARLRKDFQSSDAIRDEFKAKGLELRDRPEGTDWTFGF